MNTKYDFSGYATKNDIVCGDGRIIRHDAFKDSDGTTVPIVWQHIHNDPTNVLGHALLENHDDGVYANCKLNDSERGKAAKELVRHGDINSMSIYANKLQQNGQNVIHGVIREISLVLAGANPGALIDNLSFAHSDGTYTEVEDEAVIYGGLTGNFVTTEEQPVYISHAEAETKNEAEAKNEAETKNESETDEETVADVWATMTKEQQKLVEFLMQQAAAKESGAPAEPAPVEHADDSGDGRTLQDVWDTMTDKQKKVAQFLVGTVIEAVKNDESDSSQNGTESVKHDAMEDNMKHNVFDGTMETGEKELSHSELNDILAEAKKYGSAKEAFIEHGITDLDVLFPEAKLVTPTPDMITRPMGWVSKVWNATKKSPFARIKSTAADLTAADARAKGYIKGKRKVEEQFGLLKRVTTPQTVYKKQKLDRNDIIDITDIDVVAWLKSEMRMMLDEELSRAILVGDGRSSVSDDKIKEDNIRPIYQDDDMYTIHYQVTYAQGATDDDKSATLIDAAIKSRKDYRGSGNPSFYASTDVITQMLLARDKIGRRLYNTEAELASALRVREIVEVPVMENVNRTDEDHNSWTLLGLIVDLNDYTVGADRGGAVTLFDDFDIDYNQQKYLIETRVSGALTHPYSAIALEIEAEDIGSE